MREIVEGVSIKTRLLSSVVAACLLSAFIIVSASLAPVSAASVSITGGTNGPNCDSGGYFTPSSTTVNSGDTVTISVPSNDQYPGGMEVFGFPGGPFTIARGGSHTTAALTASVSYYGTWPNEQECMKGSGTITVNAPAPPPNSSGSSAPPASNKSSASPSPATGSNKATPAAPTSNPAAPVTQTPANQADPTDTATGATKASPAKSGTISNTANTSDAKAPKLKGVAIIGGGGLVIIVAALIVWWRLFMPRRLHASVEQPAQPVQLVQSVQPQQPQSPEQQQSVGGSPHDNGQ